MNDSFAEWPVPFSHPLYGWYHVLWILIAIAGTVFFIRFNSTEKNRKYCDRVIFGFGLNLLILEIYKQIFMVCLEGPYDWNVFPFQFCSTPMYIMVIAPMLKEGNVKEALYKFLAYFGCLAGISVLAYPTVVSEAVYLTMILHTMIWHVSMILAGVCVLSAKGYGRDFRKDFLPGITVLLILMAIATALNFILPLFLDEDAWINFFYISYYHGSTLPFLSSIYHEETNFFKWILLLIAYTGAFSFGAYLIFLVSKLAHRRTAKQLL